MKGFMNVQDMVSTMLERCPKTRGSDALLYVKICNLLEPGICDKPFEDILLNRKAYGLPDYETVGRARRRVQAKRVDLRASKEVEDERYENWKEAREYAIQ